MNQLFLVLSFVVLFIVGCTSEQPTPFSPQAEIEEAKQPKTPDVQGIQGGTFENENDELDSRELKKAADLDALLNAGRPEGGDGAPAQKISKKYTYEFEYGFTYDYEYDYEYDYYYDYGYQYDYTYDEDYYYYYDYSTYYDSYYYYYDDYDYIDYSTDDYWGDYDYFGRYYNYRDRSSYEIWATYEWPSGYGAFTCHAQSLFGDLYYGFGYPATYAEDTAIEACYDDGSWYCYSLGCY